MWLRLSLVWESPISSRGPVTALRSSLRPLRTAGASVAMCMFSLMSDRAFDEFVRPIWRLEELSGDVAAIVHVIPKPLELAELMLWNGGPRSWRSGR